MYTLDFISDCVSPSPHFSAFSFFGPNRFRVGKKIYGRYGIYTGSKNCLYYISFKWNPWSVNIMYLYVFISIWVSPPPSFPCIFMVWTKHITSRKKNYWRYCLYTASTNCVYYSSFKWNHWFVNIMSLSDFTSIWISLSPSFSCIFVKGGYTPKLIKSKVYIVLP